MKVEIEMEHQEVLQAIRTWLTQHGVVISTWDQLHLDVVLIGEGEVRIAAKISLETPHLTQGPYR